MVETKIIKQAKGTSRTQVEIYTLTAISNHKYSVRRDVHDNRMKQEFEDYSDTWDYLDYQQAAAKFHELIGAFTYTQLADDGYATLKVIKNLSAPHQKGANQCGTETH